jgi:hypothetical protein
MEAMRLLEELNRKEQEERRKEGELMRREQ